MTGRTSRTKPLNFFILGAAKCGTTSMHYYLDQHPEIYMSNPKEPLFFESEYEQGLKYYWERYYSGWTGQPFVGEARHRNLYLPYVPARIAKSFPDAKLLVMVRNPVARAYSHYLHRKTHGLEYLSFEKGIELDMERIASGKSFATYEEIEHYKRTVGNGQNTYFRTYIDSGYYAMQIERYLSYFSQDRLHIVFLEDFTRDPMKTYREILGFLGADLSVTGVDFDAKNKRSTRYKESIHRIVTRLPLSQKLRQYKVYKTIARLTTDMIQYVEYEVLGNKSMSKKTETFLIDHYKEHNRRLEELTKRDLSHWDRSRV